MMVTACGDATSSHRASNVIVVLVDTLRRDHVGAYGYEKETTPCMDRLAEEGFVFRRAVAPSCWTKPSVASLVTGLYPGRHGAVSRGLEDGRLCMLNPDHLTLAERMKAAGYKTAAFVTNPHIIPTFHFDQGFDDFIQPAGDAKELLAKALDWIDGRDREDKFFLYLHVLDPHVPYYPPKGYREKFVEGNPGPGAPLVRMGDPVALMVWMKNYRRWKPASPEDRFRFDYERKGAALKKRLCEGYPQFKEKLAHVDPAANQDMLRAALFLDFVGKDDPALVRRMRHLTSLYDGEIAYADEALGRFVEGLKARGLMDESILVVTADHGETFFEHDEWGHGFDVHAPEVDVPLIFRVPGSGGVIKGSFDLPVSLVDVYPTILHMLDLSRSSDIDGVSLWPVMRNPDQSAMRKRPVFSEVFLKGQDRVAAMMRGKKAIRACTSEGAVSWLYFDLEKDPGEQNPIEGIEGKDEFTALRGLIDRFVENRALDFMNKGGEVRLSGEELRQLKALGY